MHTQGSSVGKDKLKTNRLSHSVISLTCLSPGTSYLGPATSHLEPVASYLGPLLLDCTASMSIFHCSSLRCPRSVFHHHHHLRHHRRHDPYYRSLFQRNTFHYRRLRLVLFTIMAALNVRRTVTAKMAPPRQHMVCSRCSRVEAIPGLPEGVGGGSRFCLNQGPPAKCSNCCTCCQCTTRSMQFLATQQLDGQVDNPTQEAAYSGCPSPFFGSGSGQEHLLGSQVDNPLHGTVYGLATPMLGSGSGQEALLASQVDNPQHETGYGLATPMLGSGSGSRAYCPCCQCTTRRMQFLATQQLGSQVGNPTQEAAYLWWPSPFFGTGSGHEDLLGSQVNNPLHETGYGLATPMLGSGSGSRACCPCCQCRTRRMQFLATQQLGSQVGNPTQEAAYLWWPSPFFGSGSGQEDLLGSQVDNPLNEAEYGLATPMLGSGSGQEALLASQVDNPQHETGYGLATPMLGSSSRQDEVEAAEAAAPAAPTEREKQFISMARNKISAWRWSHCMRRRMLYAYFVAWYNIESC